MFTVPNTSPTATNVPGVGWTAMAAGTASQLNRGRTVGTALVATTELSQS